MYISDGDDGDDDDDEWCDVGWEPPHIPFTGSPGAHYAPLTEKSEPVHFFQLFLSDQMLLDIVVQTNIYTQQCIAKVRAPLSFFAFRGSYLHHSLHMDVIFFPFLLYTKFLNCSL